MAPDDRATPPGSTVIDDAPRWVWPAVVAATVLLFVGQTLAAADNGWPLGRTLTALSMSVVVVLTSLSWQRARRRRE
ncbi:hypothetical protein ASD16_21005 [Cellulomonas sp. Root485]|uniref:hypothetical protein n=1 Tax=Cellulomonas sp. Root485 TaxID=1736546 RepID=UPI0006F97D47|nr:hypothetical protein [Cellulomonas sp. Root485]KQY20359.1 hypothetical protein ASD16_21005 [Cellulomonas sp. Root485]